MSARVSIRLKVVSGRSMSGISAWGRVVTVVLLTGHLHLLHQITGHRAADEAPSTRPKVAQAIASSAADCTPYLSVKMELPGRPGAVAAGG